MPPCVAPASTQFSSVLASASRRQRNTAPSHRRALGSRHTPGVPSSGARERAPPGRSQKRMVDTLATATESSSPTDDDEAAAVAHETSLFESFTAIPVVSGARLVRDHPGGATHTASSSDGHSSLTLHVTTTLRDLPSDGARVSVAQVPLGDAPPRDKKRINHPAFGAEERGVLFSSISPSGTKRLVVRAGDAAGGDRGNGLVFEIWEAGALASETLVPRTAHGTVCVDGTFGGVCWSRLERRIAYVAETAMLEDVTPEWGMGVTRNAKAGDTKNENAKTDQESLKKDPTKKTWRGRGEWREDWGEQLVGRVFPAVFVFELETGCIKKVKGLPPGSCAASGPAWAPVVDDSKNEETESESTQLVCAVWSADIANFKSTSRRLGLVFCFNRPAGLWLVDVGVSEKETPKETAALCLARDVKSALCPRFSPDGKHLLYVSHDRAVVSGAHAATAALRVISWDKELTGFEEQAKRFESKEQCAKLSRDVLRVDTEQKAKGSFPGYYASSPLVSNPWVGNDTVVVQTTWGFAETLIRVDVMTGEISRLTAPVCKTDGAWIGENSSNHDEAQKNERRGSWQLTDVCDGVVAAVFSTPMAPPHAMVCWLHPSDAHYNQSLLFSGWHPISRPVKSPVAQPAITEIAKLEYFTQDVSRSVEDDCYLLTKETEEEDAEGVSSGDFAAPVVQSLVVRRKDLGVKNDDAAVTTVTKPKPPLIILPHGGPHGACVAGWAGSVAFLASLGYVVAYVNYRGSTGYGEKSLQSLIDTKGGGPGVRDVADCVAVAKRCVNDGLCDPEKICVVGGSHGGFLGGHLVGQINVENRGVDFKCAVLRNPVTDIASMVFATDIPDWCFVETVGIGEYTDDPQVETLRLMREKSPIAHVKNVALTKKPVLMLIGAADLRVPPTNGLRYAAALKQHGGVCDVRVFPEDSHGLVKPRTEFESFVTIAKFLRNALE